MKISLHGAYYDPNFGDILIMKLFSKWINEYDESIVINYPRIDKSIIKDCPEPTESGMKNLLNSNALVFFGGGYFGEPAHRLNYWSIRNLYKYCSVALMAELFRIPYSIIGVEFGPLSKPWLRRTVLNICKSAVFIVARNIESLDFLESNGIDKATLSYDSALSLSDYIKPSSSKKGVVLHLAHINASNRSKFLIVARLISNELKEAKIHNVTIVEDSVKQIKDNQFSDILNEFARNKIECSIVRYRDTNSLIQVINEAEYVVTTKLHVGITAVALNTKVLSFYTHPKTKRFHDQIGNSAFCIPMENVDDSIGPIINAFFQTCSFSLPSACVELAKENKRVLIGFLDDIKK